MRILFLVHSYGRTGAGVALHRYICNADRREFEMAVAARAGGELLAELPSDVKAFDCSQGSSFESDGQRGRPLSLRERALSSIYHRSYMMLHGRVHAELPTRAEECALNIQRLWQPDLWYVNTIMQPDIIRAARANRIPCILHVQELENMLAHLKESEVEDLINYPRLIIAGSERVREMLRVLGRVAAVEVCNAGIDLREVRPTPEKRAALRRELGIEDDEFVWLMAGTLDLNKNPLLFVEAAHRLLKEERRTHFVWIGSAENGFSRFARHRAADLKIDDKVSWVRAPAEEYYDYLNIADGFVLTSTQESLSLVMIESAALGKPVVSFASGGPSEIFREGMGVIVGEHSAGALAGAMLASMRGEVKLDARVSRERAADFDISVVGQRWQAILRRYAETYTQGNARGRAGVKLP